MQILLMLISTTMSSGYVVDLSVAAGHKLEFLYRARQNFQQPIWQHHIKLKFDFCNAAFPTSFALLNVVGLRAIGLIDR